MSLGPAAEVHMAIVFLTSQYPFWFAFPDLYASLGCQGARLFCIKQISTSCLCTESASLSQFYFEPSLDRREQNYYKKAMDLHCFQDSFCF